MTVPYAYVNAALVTLARALPPTVRCEPTAQWPHAPALRCWWGPDAVPDSLVVDVTTDSAGYVADLHHDGDPAADTLRSPSPYAVVAWVLLHLTVDETCTTGWRSVDQPVLSPFLQIVARYCPYTCAPHSVGGGATVLRCTSPLGHVDVGEDDTVGGYWVCANDADDDVVGNLSLTHVLAALDRYLA
jgi:hypothetical protein